MHPTRPTAAALIVFALTSPVATFADEPKPNDDDFEAVMSEQLEEWTDAGMPEDLIAQIEAGAEGFQANCAECHGALGQGGSGYPNRIIGGQGLHKFRTAQRLFIYNRSMMPFQDPGSLPEDQMWDITAWIMAMNGWLDETEEALGPDIARESRIGE